MIASNQTNQSKQSVIHGSRQLYGDTPARTDARQGDSAIQSGVGSKNPAMTEVGKRNGGRMTFHAALEAAKDGPQSGGGDFLRLTDKEAVEVVFTGEALKIVGTWRDNRFVPWRDEYAAEGLRQKVRYALGVIKLDERRGMVLEVNQLTFLELGEDLAGGIEEVVVKLRRIGGRGDPKARITARPVRNLRADESDALDAVSKPSLEGLYAEFLEEASN